MGCIGKAPYATDMAMATNSPTAGTVSTASLKFFGWLSLVVKDGNPLRRVVVTDKRSEYTADMSPSLYTTLYMSRPRQKQMMGE